MATKKKKSLFEGEELVTIKLPKDKKIKEDKFVAVNGRIMAIKRGVEVQVPKSIKEVLDHEEEMLDIGMEYEEELHEKSKAKQLD